MTPTLDEKQAAPKGSRVDLGRYAGTYGGYIEKEAMTKLTAEEVAAMLQARANEHHDRGLCGTEEPLAALIRAVTHTHFCRVCNGNNREEFSGGYRVLPGPVHAYDCALIALCRAITGEGER